MDTIIKYKTKQEKVVEDENKVLESLYKIEASDIHNQIKTILRDIHENLKVEDALELYLNARALRHQNWEEYLNLVKSNDSFDFGDKSLKKFVQDIRCKGVMIDDTDCDLTPDILIYNEKLGNVYLGDIAVTTSTHLTTQRKYEKYLKVKKFLTDNDFIVTDSYFIIDENLMNLQESINKLTQMGLIEDHKQVHRLYSRFSLLCNKVLKLIPENTNKIDFNTQLRHHDKIIIEKATNINLIDEVKNIDISEYQPKLTEDQIIHIIKDKMETIDHDDYFTDDITKTIKAMDQLIENNKDKLHTKPKSVLKVCDNPVDIESYNNHDLVLDYVKDLLTSTEVSPILEHLLYILPTIPQIKTMKKIYDESIKQEHVRNNKDFKEINVFGPNQYDMFGLGTNYISANMNFQLQKGKKLRNDKKEPMQIDLRYKDDYYLDIERSIKFFGNRSMKPPVLTDEWDSSTKFESDNTQFMRDIYNYVRSTNGAQLCSSLDHLYERLTHLSCYQSTKTNIIIPPNASFISIVPKQHAPTSAKNVDLPFIFITRYSKLNSSNYEGHFDYEHKINTSNYTYYISKLCRLNIDKIQHWSNSQYRLIAASSYILNKSRSLNLVRDKVVGLLTYLTLDVHQKTSEFLDLLKYISFMPFAEISRLPELVKDKFDLLLKTKLDAWMIVHLREFIIALSDRESLKVKKPKLKTFNTDVSPQTLGINMRLPSFFSTSIRHEQPGMFIEEIGLIFVSRPKHLYGSQFLDKSTTDTVKWDLEMEEDKIKYGGWIVDGYDKGPYPFESKFAFSSDAIYYATKLLNEVNGVEPGLIDRKLGNNVYSRYLHDNCSLRGATKHKSERSNQSDIHTTSMEAVLKYYRSVNYDEEMSKTINIAQHSIKEGNPHEYSMSEKDQRGGGRPIATPTLFAKAELMMVEKPEATLGQFYPNNIIVPNRNKGNYLCETYKDALSEGIRHAFKKVYQLTEDQTKFSENDNLNKYITYIKSNSALSDNIRKLQLKVIERVKNRIHLIKKLPIGIKNTSEYLSRVVDTPTSLGVRTSTGWPQGMLNFISTSVHCAADIWITKAYNKAYPNNKVRTKGLVHSDDSWVVVMCNNKDDFKKFSLFRVLAKRLFCLKVNEKKLWGSSYLGELVSNFNLNGTVYFPVIKTIINSFNNLNYQNWVIDVHSQISSIQQTYRNGGTMSDLVLLGTILRQQTMNRYKVKGMHKQLIKMLPVDLGGYPDISVFELGVSGLSSHYYDVLNKLKNDPESDSSKIIKQILCWSLGKKRGLSDQISNDFDNDLRKAIDNMHKDSFTWKDMDYDNLILPGKNSLFECIKHIMPRSKKISITISELRSLPFEDNGLGGIITNPKDISESLGHLKGKSINRSYELASEKYTQSARRLAINQSIQSTGKVIRINDSHPISFTELYGLALSVYKKTYITLGLIDEALNDGNDTVMTARLVVHNSNYCPSNNDKRRVINKMPDVESKYTTISDIKDVLLRKIDKSNCYSTNYYRDYGRCNTSLETVDKDVELISDRFYSFFKYYKVVQSCTMIFQSYTQVKKSKLWTQPSLKNDNIITFLEDLYGKTINDTVNYSIRVNDSSSSYKKYDQDIVHSMYNIAVLDTIYKDKFKLLMIDNKEPSDALRKIDYRLLEYNDQLMYGTLELMYNNNHEILRNVIKDHNYSQHYIKKQKYRNGRYVGELDILVKLGQTVLRIYGEPSNFSIVSNITSIPEILEAMRIFILNNFKYDSYPNKYDWGSRSIWNSNQQFSKHYLNWWGISSSTISSSRARISVPIIIDSDLHFDNYYEYELDYDITVGDNLRVIYRESVNSEKRRIANIRQNMKIPYRNKLILEPIFLDGFITDDLVRLGIMENSILQTPTNLNIEDCINLLKTNIDYYNNKPIIISFINLLKFCTKDTVMIDNPRFSSNKIEVVLDDEVVDFIPTKMIELVETTEPEDLEALIDDNDLNIGRVGSVRFLNNIFEFICECIIGSITEHRLNSFIHHLIYDVNIIKWVKQYKHSKEYTLDDLMEVLDLGIAQFDIDPILFSFIIVSCLDMDKGWKKINSKLLTDTSWSPESSQFLNSMCNLFCKNINENIFSDDLKIKISAFDI